MNENNTGNKQISYITPKAEDLLLNRILNCPEANCSTTFNNLQNLKMHLTKHHKIVLKEDHFENNQIKLYYCPDISCNYNREGGKGKHFTSLKYVRQHYQKVHAERNFKCEKCEKQFISPATLNAHLKMCGKKFICDECGWEYNSREALLTHIKRKGHKIQHLHRESAKDEISNKKNKIKIPPYDPNVKPIQVFVKILSDQNDKAVQTETLSLKRNASKRKFPQKQTVVKCSKLVDKESTPKSPVPCHTVKPEGKPQLQFSIFEETGADKEKEKKNLNNLSYAEDTMNSCFDQLVSSSFCHIETQTEFPSTILDQMLYSNTHTQTCDEFLSELGLADIQTQTNWSGIPDPAGRNNVAGSASGAHDELLVSTETQTSFTQCLLECNGSSTPGITQHTQTCDTLLEGLFGGQESDLIGNFQSTHTQT